MIKLGGTGRHTVSLSPATRRTALKLATVSQIICPTTTTFSKLGVLCLFDRILKQSGRPYRIIIRATFVVVLATMIVQVLIPFINCRPFSKQWSPTAPGECSIPTLSLWRYLGIPNVFTTLIVVAIPVPALVKLNVSRPVKCGLAVVFVVCLAGVVAAFMRVQSFLRVEDFHDITYENVKPLCWIVAESGIYLVAGVMLTLRPLLTSMFKDTALERMLARSSGSSRSWGSRRFGRGWHRSSEQAPSLPPMRKLSPMPPWTAEATGPVGSVVPAVHHPEPRWV